MGSLSGGVDNGTPNVHCGKLGPHEFHPNYVSVEGAAIIPQETRADGTWCDGVPPLASFVELTVRVPLEQFFGQGVRPEHSAALALLHDEGLGIIIDQVTEEGTSAVLRVRAGGQDRVYPLVKRKGFPGFKAVVDAPGV